MLTLAAYLHSINPWVVRFPDVSLLPAGIRWYGVSYILGFLLAFLLMRRVTRVGRSTLAPARVGDLVVTVAIGVVVGGRLGYVLFYRPSLLWMTMDHPPFWGLLAINEGGMASHGGMMGAVLGALFFARRFGHSWGHVLDLCALGTPLGLGMGRVANFINGELYGRACSPNLPWAVQFPQEMATWLRSRAPEDMQRLEQLQAALPDLARGRGGLDAARMERIIEAVQQGNAQAIQAIQSLNPPLPTRHPSQLYEALLEGVVVFLALVWVWRKPRKPAVVGGWFCVVYALARIVAEFFRMPDAHIAHQEFAALHLTRGQLLSVGLLAAGVALVVLAGRRAVEPLGGWRRPAALAADAGPAAPTESSGASPTPIAPPGRKRRRSR